MSNKFIRYFWGICLIFCGVFVISFCFEKINYRSLATDSGFDSSWDSGGSSGGSYDGGESFFGLGSLIEGNDTIAIALAFLVELLQTFFYAYFVYASVHPREKSVKECWRRASSGVKSFFIGRIIFLSIFNFVSPGKVCELDYIIGIIVIMISLEKTKAIINKNVSFLTKNVSSDVLEKFNLPDSASLKKEFYDKYVKIQEAWSINNIEKARDVLSDNLFNMYKTQILTMDNKNERNVMSDFSYISSYINDVYTKDNLISVVVSMEVYCKDYMINTKTEEVIRGNSDVVNHYFYVMTFTKNVVSDKIETCPNCNAKISSSGNTAVCEYCGSVVNKTSSNFVLTDKKMAIQKKK